MSHVGHVCEDFLGQPKEESGLDVPSSESLIFVLACLCVPLLLWAYADGLLVG